jgi:hypothetical protein
MIFLHMAPICVRFRTGFFSGAVFNQEAICSSVVLAHWRSSSPEYHIWCVKVRLLQQSSESGVRRGLIWQSSRTILEQFAPQKSFFPHEVRCDEIALRKSLLLGEIQG